MSVAVHARPAVAELTVGLIIALQRRIVSNDAGLREGAFATLRAGVPKNTELRHQTLGVIGMGRIGRVVSRRMPAGMEEAYPVIRDVGPLPVPAARCESAEEVYRRAGGCPRPRAGCRGAARRRRLVPWAA